MPEVLHGDHHLQHPTPIHIGVVVHRAVQRRLQSYALALPFEVDILGALLASLESHVVEEGAVGVHLVTEIGSDVFGVRCDKDLDGVLFPHGTILLGHLSIDVRVDAFVQQVQGLVVVEHSCHRRLGRLLRHVIPWEYETDLFGGIPGRIVAPTVDDDGGGGASDDGLGDLGRTFLHAL